MAKAKPKGRLFQLTRDEAGSKYYSLWGWSHRPRLRYGIWRCGKTYPTRSWPAKSYHHTAEQSARLPKGGGPIRVRVIIEAEE